MVPEWDGAGSNKKKKDVSQSFEGLKGHVGGLGEEVQILGFLQCHVEFKPITTIVNKTDNNHDDPVIFSKDNLSCAL